MHCGFDASSFAFLPLSIFLVHIKYPLQQQVIANWRLLIINGLCIHTNSMGKIDLKTKREHHRLKGIRFITIKRCVLFFLRLFFRSILFLSVPMLRGSLEFRL